MSRINKFLALTLLFLAAYASWYWVQHKKAEREGSGVFKTALDSAHSIRIDVSGKPSINLVKKKGGWVMVKPVEDLVEETRVKELLAYAGDITKERIISPSVRDLSIFGLSPPEASLAIETESALHQVNFGHKTVDEERVFACTNAGNEVFLLPFEIRKNLPDKSFRFREKRLLSPDKNDILYLAASLGGTEIEFEKSDSGWKQTKGPRCQDVPETVDELVRNLDRSLILDFINRENDRSGTYGLDPPRLRVKVAGKGGVQTLLFGNEGREGFVYAMASGRPGVMLVDNPYTWITKTLNTNE